MQTSTDGRAKLELREGLRLQAYKDSVGVWTIGYGHTSNAGSPKVNPGLTISKEEADAILTKDLASFEKDVNEVFPNGMPQQAFDGAVSFHYNTGAIKRASWPTLYKAGNMVEAKAHFLEWNKPPEIIGRRKQEAAQIFNPIDLPTTIPVQTPQLPTQTPTIHRSFWITLLRWIFLGHS